VLARGQPTATEGEESTDGAARRTHGGSIDPCRRAAVEAGRCAVAALFVGGVLSPGDSLLRWIKRRKNRKKKEAHG
jgi:hypothetical protein